MRLIVTALVLPLLLTGCGGEGSDGPDSAVPDLGGISGAGEDASGDVKVSGCQRGDQGLVNAAVVITNSAKESKTYLVLVGADDPDGNRVADVVGVTDAVAPGQTVTVDATGAASRDDVPEKLTCKVLKVTRS